MAFTHEKADVALKSLELLMEAGAFKDVQAILEDPDERLTPTQMMMGSWIIEKVNDEQVAEELRKDWPALKLAAIRAMCRGIKYAALRGSDTKPEIPPPPPPAAKEDQAEVQMDCRAFLQDAAEGKVNLAKFYIYSKGRRVAEASSMAELNAFCASTAGPKPEAGLAGVAFGPEKKQELATQYVQIGKAEKSKNLTITLAPEDTKASNEKAIQLIMDQVKVDRDSAVFALDHGENVDEAILLAHFMVDGMGEATVENRIQMVMLQAKVDRDQAIRALVLRRDVPKAVEFLEANKNEPKPTFKDIATEEDAKMEQAVQSVMEQAKVDRDDAILAIKNSESVDEAIRLARFAVDPLPDTMAYRVRQVIDQTRVDRDQATRALALHGNVPAAVEFLEALKEEARKGAEEEKKQQAHVGYSTPYFAVLNRADGAETEDVDAHDHFMDLHKNDMRTVMKEAKAKPHEAIVAFKQYGTVEKAVSALKAMHTYVYGGGERLLLANNGVEDLIIGCIMYQTKLPKEQVVKVWKETEDMQLTIDRLQSKTDTKDVIRQAEEDIQIIMNRAQVDCGTARIARELYGTVEDTLEALEAMHRYVFGSRERSLLVNGVEELIIRHIMIQTDSSYGVVEQVWIETEGDMQETIDRIQKTKAMTRLWINGIAENKMKAIMEHTGVSHEEAVAAYNETKDVAKAIDKLQEAKKKPKSDETKPSTEQTLERLIEKVDAAAVHGSEEDIKREIAIQRVLNFTHDVNRDQAIKALDVTGSDNEAIWALNSGARFY